VKRKFVAVKWGITPIGIASGNARYHFDGRYDMQTEVYQHNFFDGTTLAMHLTAHTTQPTTLPTIFPVHWYQTEARNAAGSSVQTVSSGQMNTSGSNLLVHLEGTLQNYSNGSFLRDTVFVITAGSGNRTNHKFFAVGRNVVDSFRTGQVCAYFLFEELQKKDSVHKLTFTIRRRWARDLSAEP